MLLFLALLACHPDTDAVWPALVAGAPEAGVAEGTLDLPVGTPLGGYSGRATYLGADTKQDNRASPYSVAFVESTGVHTRPGIKAIWIDNGDQDLVLLQTDAIYSYDNLVTRVTEELEAKTGRDLKGKVVHSVNHSHNSYGPFSDQIHFYLGGDKYNEEIFERYVQQLVDVAMKAYAARKPAAIGMGWAKDWDPDDKVYHDRRGENDNLVVWDDLPPGGDGKDPYLNVIRVDDATDGSPMALVYTFGIHGTVLEGSMISSDASGGIDAALEEAFDSKVVVMHLQSGAGDASPSGTDDGFARVETIGEYARDPILALYQQVQTSSDPIKLESVSRHIWQHRDQIHVTRNGTTDLYYAPYDEGHHADDVVYEDDGRTLKSPIDEFNAEYGAAFCGADSPLIPAGAIGSDVYPYSTCTDLGLLSGVIKGIFGIDEFPLPLPESMKAGTLAVRLGPIPVLKPDGSQVEEDLFAGFFPAEPTSMYTEQWRRRVKAELGYDMPLIVGYAQDHEGYFLIPEDWLMGGYEPNIAIWGPLQGEHVMEQVIGYSKELLGKADESDDAAEDADPDGYYAPTVYADKPLPTNFQPDLTEDAGTRLTELPAYLWTPNEIVADPITPATVHRVQGIVQLVWKGGDPMVDEPRVVLERQDGDAWTEVTTRSGRPVDDTFTDVLTAWTPDPLYPAEDPQTHYWWAGWQAVGHMADRKAVPTGTYRLHAYGKRYTGGDTQWPWSTADYEVTSDPFEVVPAELSVQVNGDGTLSVALPAPADGWRLVDVDGSSRGDNPVRGAVTVAIDTGDGVETQTVEPDAISGGRSHLPVDVSGATSVTVTDADGNSGTIAL